VISVRQTRALPPAFFRFHLTMDTLALGYTLPTTRVCYGLSPIRLRPYWAHTKSSGFEKSKPLSKTSFGHGKLLCPAAVFFFSAAGQMKLISAKLPGTNPL